MILKTEVQIRNPHFTEEGEGQGTEPRPMPALDQITSGAGITIKQAWEKINQNAQQILFVLDGDRRIIGAVSDGDVRRWVLAEKGLGASVTLIMNRNPVTASELEGPASTLTLKAGIERILKDRCEGVTAVRDIAEDEETVLTL